MAKFRCIVDGIKDSYDTCVIDESEVTGCVEASKLISQGKSKEDCEYWKEVLESDKEFDTKDTDIPICPYCGNNDVIFDEEDGYDKAECEECNNAMKISVKVLYTTEKLGDTDLEV